MVEMRSSAMRHGSDAAARRQEAKAKALELRTSAQRAAHSLFESGDLTDYLDLVCRFHHYDACNLLLIHQQFPRATCLAGYNVWKQMLNDPSALILKPEWRGKGIDLIAPLLESPGNGQLALTWGAVKQFDISQTNVTGYKPPGSCFIQDGDHLHHLLKAIIEVISTEHHRSVVRVASSHLRSVGAVGQLGDITIQLRSDAKPVQQVQFLLECLCQLSMETESAFTAPQKDLAMQYILCCMFRIWGVELPRRLYPSPQILKSIVPDLRMDFLSLLQRTIRSLDESISAAYVYSRAGEGLDKDLDFYPHPDHSAS